MAFSRDFSNVNQAIQRMMSFLMQNKLGELSNERYMDTLSEQDRLMRERAAESDVMARKASQEKYNQDIQLELYKSFLEGIKQPPITRIMQNIERYNMVGDTASAEAEKKKFEAIYPSVVNAIYTANTGERPLSEQQIWNFGIGGGLENMINVSKTGSSNYQFEQELPIKKQQAATSAGNLALNREQFGLEKEKFGAEQGRPGVLGEKQKTQYLDAINKATDFLVGQGVIGDKAGLAYYDVMGGGGKTLNPMSSENQGKTLTALNELRLQIIKGVMPTPNQEAFLSKVWNVPQIQAEGLPSMQTGLTPNETTDAESRINQNIEALVTNQIMQRLGLQEDRRDYARQLAREFLAGMK